MSKFTSAIIEYVYSIAKTNMGISSCFFYPKPANIFNLARHDQVLDFEQLLSLLRKNDYLKLKDDNFNEHELDAVEFINANFEIVNNAKNLSIFQNFSENTLLIEYCEETEMIQINLLFSILDKMHIGKKKQLDCIVAYVKNNNKNNNQLLFIQETQYEEFVKQLDNELSYKFEIGLVTPSLNESVSSPNVMSGLCNLIQTHPVFKRKFKKFYETEKVSLFKILQPKRYMQELIGFVRYHS